MMRPPFTEDIDRILETMARLSEAGGESPDDQIHMFRKSGKRVRALIELFYPGRGGEVRRLRRKIAEVARTLSHARDRHVAIRTAKQILASVEGPVIKGAANRMLQEFIEEYSSDLEKDSETLRGGFLLACQRIGKLRKRFREIAASVKATEPSIGLLHSYRLGRTRVKHVMTEPVESERFHDLRKVTKQLGYQMDWMEGAGRLSLPSMKNRCGELGDLLGDALDLKRLAEQVEDWLLNKQAKGGKAKKADAKVASELVLELFASGMAQCRESTNLACRLYFEGGKSFSRRLGFDESVNR
jgi:CHAD domain-containing protein